MPSVNLKGYKKSASNTAAGFTLIELLVVIAILSILAVVVFVALNPVQRFKDSRNARRRIDVANYLTAVHECIVDNDGATSPCFGSLADDEVYEIVSSGSSGCDDVCTGATNDTHCAELDTLLEDYLKELPTDPSGVASGHTEYSISFDVDNGMVSINACSAEDETIEAAR